MAHAERLRLVIDNTHPDEPETPVTSAQRKQALYAAKRRDWYEQTDRPVPAKKGRPGLFRAGD